MKQRQVVKHTLENSRRDYYRHSIENASDQREIFKVTANLLGTNSTDTLPAHSSKEKLCECFSNFFVSKVDTIRCNLQGQSRSPICDNTPNLPLSPEILVFEPTSVPEVEQIIRGMKNKSCKLDPAPTWVVKSCLGQLSSHITKVINTSFRESVVPIELKQALAC